VCGVSVNLDDDPVVLHRGSVKWGPGSFDRESRLIHRDLIKEDTIVTVDRDKGKVLSSFGGGLLYMPHGITVDTGGNVWVTDTGLHQVFKFNKGQEKPSLVLGEAFVPGNDKAHFCQPTSTAVASSGVLFVADGYCNSRVAVFSPEGKFLHEIQGKWLVVHSIVLYEQEDILCVADREGRKVECLGAGLKNPQFRGMSSTILPNLGRVFAIAGRGSALLAVNGKGSYFDPTPRGVSYDLAADNSLVDEWGKGLQSPHGLAISRNGDSVYVAEIGPNVLRKFEVVAPEQDLY